MTRFVPVEELFSGRHFDREIVALCVCWYQSYKLSYRDLVAMMAERGVIMAHTTILRWVQHYSPEFQKRWRRFARTVGGLWRMDETYIQVKGEWMYRQPFRHRRSHRHHLDMPLPHYTGDSPVNWNGRNHERQRLWRIHFRFSRLLD
jgi:hypothetical protein